MTTLDISKFNKKEIAILAETGDQVPRATFCDTDGRSISLPYNLLNECVLASDGTVILANFGETEAIIVGEKLGPIFDEICAHRLAKIQAVDMVKSVDVGPAEQKEPGLSDIPTV